MTPEERAKKDQQIRDEDNKAIEAKARRDAENRDQAPLIFGGRHSRQSGWKGTRRGS